MHLFFLRRLPRDPHIIFYSYVTGPKFSNTRSLHLNLWPGSHPTKVELLQQFPNLLPDSVSFCSNFHPVLLLGQSSLNSALSSQFPGLKHSFRGSSLSRRLSLNSISCQRCLFTFSLRGMQSSSLWFYSHHSLRLECLHLFVSTSINAVFP